jgi:hypothetical protein
MKERKSGSAEWLVVQWKSIIEGSSIQKILKILHSLKKLTRKPQNEENIGTSSQSAFSLLRSFILCDDGCLDFSSQSPLSSQQFMAT